MASLSILVLVAWMLGAAANQLSPVFYAGYLAVWIAGVIGGAHVMACKLRGEDF